jgi:hypothetical protein
VEPGGRAEQDRHRDAGRDPPPGLARALEHVAQVLPVDVLERVEVGVAGATDVDHPGDVGVVQARCEARLVEEHGDERRVARVVGQDPLEHDPGFPGRRARRPRQVQLGHTAGREVTHQLVRAAADGHA